MLDSNEVKFIRVSQWDAAVAASHGFKTKQGLHRGRRAFFVDSRWLERKAEMDKKY